MYKKIPTGKLKLTLQYKYYKESQYIGNYQFPIWMKSLPRLYTHNKFLNCTKKAYILFIHLLLFDTLTNFIKISFVH